jgi:hypothetical protein
MAGHGLARVLKNFGYRPDWAENYRKKSKEDETPRWRPRNKRSSSQERRMEARIEANGGMPLLSRGPTREMSVDELKYGSESNIQLSTQGLQDDAVGGSEKPGSPHRPSASTITFVERKTSQGVGKDGNERRANE